jgi:adenosylcobinamide-GDP ribazoletransferase
MRAILTALGFLSRIPVPWTGQVDDQEFSRAVIYFPLVGALIGVINAGAFMLFDPWLPRPVTSILIITLNLILTGGMHFDGLLDSCDGLFSGRSRERSLEIMRDSRVGAMGVMAGIIDVIFRYSLLNVLPAEQLPGLLIASAVVSRWVMAAAVENFPYARAEGGLGQAFHQHKNIIYTLISTVLAILIMLAVIKLQGVLVGIAAAILALLIAGAIGHKLGGLTGDIYGGLNELSEVLFLLIWLGANAR